jgi:hypothetical protein
MSLATKIADLATRLGTEFKTVRTEIASAQTAAEAYADGLAVNYDAAGSAAAAQTAAEAYADALDSDDIAEGATNLYFTDERVQDVLGTAIVAGSNITATYDDGAGTLTLSAASGYTSSSFNTDLAAKTTNDLAEGTTNKYFTAQRALDATASAYDAAGSAATAEDNANSYTDSAISGLINGAPSALDTLNELASALGSDANFSTTIATALGNRVRVDEAQSFNATQKTQGRDNIGAASAADVGDVSSANFVTTFEAALV